MLKSTQLQELWNELYARKGEGWLTVLSGSMAPMIRIGDRVLVKRTAPQQIRFGDIIVFKEADRLITHRVIGRRVSNQHIIFLQKGDCNTFATVIFAESMIGKVACISKGEGCIRLDNLLGRYMNLLLGTSFYVLHLLRKHGLDSRLAWLFRRCLNALFMMCVSFFVSDLGTNV